LATTLAISTAVAALVSTALLFVSFLLVVLFRLLVVPNGPSTTHQELVFDFTAGTYTLKPLVHFKASPDFFFISCPLYKPQLKLFLSPATTGSNHVDTSVEPQLNR
jgi:hypothetical protein